MISPHCAPVEVLNSFSIFIDTQRAIRMIPAHREFSVEIKKLKFETDQGILFPHTALVRFHTRDKDQPVVDLLGHMGENELYEAIDRGEAINLDQCYVEKFSLRDYRLTRNLDPREKIHLKGFTARNSLFGANSSLDFSFAVVEGEEFSLEGAWLSRGDLCFESACFRNERTSFHNTRFGDGNLNFKNVRFEAADISFKNARFGEGDKDFQYLSTSRGKISFINTDFSAGNVNFINADFGKGDVSFKVARFGRGRVDFHFASFKCAEVSFERCEFGDGRVDFRTVEFGSARVNFNRSVFGDGEVSFDECGLDGGKFSFKRVDFGKGDISFEELMFENVEASFERSYFGSGKLSFYRSWFSVLSLNKCHLDGYVDLRVMKSRKIDLDETVVRDILDIHPHDFISQIEVLSLAGMRLIGRIYIDWKQCRVKDLVYSQQNRDHRVIAEQFRILKENFENQGLYSYEDRAYVEFKRNESRAELHEALRRNPWGALWHYPLYWFKLLLFDRAGLYATSPVRVLITMLVSFVLFSFLYYVLMVSGEADIIASVDDYLGDMPRAFYHSAITFLTIGYGDHYPYGSIRWVSAIEGFFGLFLMSYFTVAFVRKVLR